MTDIYAEMAQKSKENIKCSSKFTFCEKCRRVVTQFLILSSHQVKNFASDLKEGEGLHIYLKREQAWEKEQDLEDLISGIQDF